MITVEPILLDVDVSVEEYELEYTDDSALSVDLDTAIIVTNIEGEHYDGETIVDPTFSTQTLETRNKVMDDDVTVNSIYVGKTTNVSGGYTVYVGMI